ncbi:MAG: GNAT family N-acetyltransferase [Novosphingobium sp.]|nr:GNAT family N-acetyltransferase [Novosphingobium sp.]
MADTIFETGRLVLRTEAPGDLDWWMENMNTPAVMRHLAGVQPREVFESKFARNAAGIAESGLGFWFMVLRDTGELVGHSGMCPIISPHAPEALQGHPQIGWALAERFWRRGLALEAARAVLARGFGHFGFDTIYAQTSDSNLASTAMMGRLGLRRVPELDYADPDFPAQDNPTTIYAISRDAWRADQ